LDLPGKKKGDLLGEYRFSTLKKEYESPPREGKNCGAWKEMQKKLVGGSEKKS